jgi:hypothetical protein
MMGMGRTGGFVYTPKISGKVFCIITGAVTNNTAGMGAFVYASYGTGTAPANGQAAVGTSLCGAMLCRGGASSGVGDASGFCAAGMVTGAALNTQLWFDVILASYTSGTASVSGLAFAAFEIP